MNSFVFLTLFSIHYFASEATVLFFLVPSVTSYYLRETKTEYEKLKKNFRNENFKNKTYVKIGNACIYIHNINRYINAENERTDTQYTMMQIAWIFGAHITNHLLHAEWMTTISQLMNNSKNEIDHAIEIVNCAAKNCLKSSIRLKSKPVFHKSRKKTFPSWILI